MKKTIILIATAILALASACRTNGQIVSSVSGGDELSVGPGTAGFEFTVGAQPVTIATLGVYDSSQDGVLNSSHTVGIWNASSQALVGSVTVNPSTATDVNNYFYSNLSAPITLQAGATYRIGAQYADSDLDLALGNASSTTVSGVTLKDAYLSTGSGFEFPDLNVSSANNGFFGPNAGFSAVPEPSAYALVCAIGLLGFAVYRRVHKVA